MASQDWTSYINFTPYRSEMDSLMPGSFAKLPTGPQTPLLVPEDKSELYKSAMAPDKTAVAKKKPEMTRIAAKRKPAAKPKAKPTEQPKPEQAQAEQQQTEQPADIGIDNDALESVVSEAMDDVLDGGFQHRGAAVRDPAERDDTWFSKLVGPDEDELEAANNGMRWHWALENRFMPPGSKWNETVFSGVDRENRWLSRMLSQQRGDRQSAADVRAKQTELNRLRTEYNQFIKEYSAGQWDTSSREYKEFKEAAERMRANYVAQGGNPEDLRPPPLQVGKLQQAGSKRQSDARATMTQTVRVGNVIKEALTDGTLDDPQRLQDLTIALDKEMQNIAAKIGGDASAMADAEKVRIQIQYLPVEAKAEVYKTIQNYRAAMTSIAAECARRGWSTDLSGKIDGALAAFTKSGEAGQSDLVAFGKLTGAVHDMIFGGKMNELPQDLATMAIAIQNQYDTYMNNMVLAANMSLEVSAYMAQWLYDRTFDQYNNEAFTMGRMSDIIPKKLFPEIDYKLAERAVPTDQLIKAITFPTVPPVQTKKPPKGDDTNEDITIDTNKSRKGIPDGTNLATTSKELEL